MNVAVLEKQCELAEIPRAERIWVAKALLFGSWHWLAVSRKGVGWKYSFFPGFFAPSEYYLIPMDSISGIQFKAGAGASFGSLLLIEWTSKGNERENVEFEIFFPHRYMAAFREVGIQVMKRESGELTTAKGVMTNYGPYLVVVLGGLSAMAAFILSRGMPEVRAVVLGLTGALWCLFVIAMLLIRRIGK